MLKVTCEHCGCKDIAFGLHITRSGSVTVIAECNGCHQRPQVKVPFYKKELFNIAALPIWRDERDNSEHCQVNGCHEQGAELHHFAPRFLFGASADSWPMSWLCKKHHTEWHDKVTPGMKGKKK